MAFFFYNKISKVNQYFISIALVLLVAGICYFCSGFIAYKIVALILLVTVSLIAMSFDIMPVIISAIISALVWNFFFIPPKFTLAIHSSEDIPMFVMYFIIVMINAALTYKIRKIEKEANEKEEKEKTLKLYNTLLNSLSHELRTPIATIIGATDNLQAINNKLSEQSKTELLSEISKAALRLNRQVENLLNMSRLESGIIKPKKDWCDINELVHSSVNLMQENIQKHQLKIEIEDKLPLFKIDMGLMQQVLCNLLNNAIQYTSEKAFIIIKASYTMEINGHFSADYQHAYRDDKIQRLVIIFQDNGKGFPEDEIDKVFDKFYRLKSSNTGGTGLGLSIVKGFVEAHNGTIILENVKEGGAKYTIEIPAEASYINSLKNE
jgi:two-component system, OmpR family, sensor histidine kinase KdpD